MTRPSASAEPFRDPWLRRLASVAGLATRRALWAEALRSRRADQAAGMLEAVVEAAVHRCEQAVLAYLPLVDLRTLAREVGPGVLGGVLLAARERQLEKCLFLLEDPGRGRAEESGPPPDPVVESLTVGHRKAAARGPRGMILERILKDPDPRVVRELLRNPRLREWEVLAIASRRPCSGEVAWLVVGSERWVQRPAVRRALVFNPHTAPRLAAALAVLMTGAELQEVSRQARLHPAVREGALQVLTWRGGPGEPATGVLP